MRFLMSTKMLLKKIEIHFQKMRKNICHAQHDCLKILVLKYLCMYCTQQVLSQKKYALQNNLCYPVLTDSGEAKLRENAIRRLKTLFICKYLR